MIVGVRWLVADAEVGNGERCMVRKIFSIASLISTILLGCTMLLWLGAFFVTPWDCSLSVTRDFHIGILGGFGFEGMPLGAVVFFSDKESGPYHGSILALDTVPLREVGWGPEYGIYYRHFRWLDSGKILWTLMVSLAYPLLLFSIMPAVWLWRRKRNAQVRTEGHSEPPSSQSPNLEPPR